MNELANVFKPDAHDDFEDLTEFIDDVAPQPSLPEVSIVLKSRTASTITLAWDVDADMMQMLSAVQAVYGGYKRPIYELQYRMQSTSKADRKFTDDDNEDLLWSTAVALTRACGGTVSNLHVNTPYVFRCRRVGWEKTYCQPVVIRTGPGPPCSPLQATAKEVTASSVLLAWNPPLEDNGLPVTEYLVSMKPWGGDFKVVNRSKDRVYLATGLQSNLIHVFEIRAINKAGESPTGLRYAIRTLATGAAAMTPWREVIDDRTGKMYFSHAKTGSVSWTLPQGALVDEVESFR
jgi:hypothetical protein